MGFHLAEKIKQCYNALHNATPKQKVVGTVLLLAALETVFLFFHDSAVFWILAYGLVTLALIFLVLANIIKKSLAAFLFVVPALAIFSIFYIYPFFKVLQLSQHAWDGISPKMVFVG
ncbi:MAG: hypothetical protein PHO59_06415, partial [Candidatus Omnitrophica bacterium]|nr:hypothetical protein [Candidatus Omnitrophota bacterium]